MRMKTVVRKLLGVSGIVVEELDLEEEGLVIHLRPRSGKPICWKTTERAQSDRVANCAWHSVPTRSRRFESASNRKRPSPDSKWMIRI